MSDLTVPKKKLCVTVHFKGKTKLEGSFFIGPQSINSRASEKVASLLESKKDFLPFLLSENGRTELINKHKIKAVEWEEHDDEENSALENTKRIKAIFSDGMEVTGLLVSEAPDERSRLSDCLNQPVNFLNIRVGRKHFHINKYLLQKVLDG